MSDKSREWPAEWLLEAWGLRAFGSLTTPWKAATGGKAISDDESQAAMYVEQTPGFDRAREVLTWRYRRFGVLAEFPIKLPGESLARALLRRAWGDMLGRRPSEIATAIHAQFVSALSERVLREPFRPIRATDNSEDAIEVAESVNSRFAA